MTDGPSSSARTRRGLHNWGATDDEIHGAMPGDDICAHARLVATRAITLSTPPEAVFPWIRQMGFGRAGWYSYDLIDNLGRRSATTILPEWQKVHAGDSVPGGPINFEATVVDAPHSFVLTVRPRGRMANRVCFSLAYHLREHDSGTRLVTRVRARINAPGGVLIEKLLLGPGDGVMLRRQLIGIARRTTVSS